MKNDIKPEVFDYQNLQSYLGELFGWYKENIKVFSYRWFAKKCGFASHTFIDGLLKLNKKLRYESALKLAKGLDLENAECDYFMALVTYSQSIKVEEKKDAFETMQSIKQRDALAQIDKGDWRYFQIWYYPVLRELICYSNWGGDYQTLADLVFPKITAAQAQEALGWMLSKGFLEIDPKTNTYKSKEPLLTAEGIPELSLRDCKANLLLRSIESLTNTPRHERHVSSAWLSMSNESFVKANELLAKTRREILQMAKQDQQVEKVFGLNIQMVPLSKNLKRGPL